MQCNCGIQCNEKMPTFHTNAGVFQCVNNLITYRSAYKNARVHM
jgi:hypothetical protein